MVQWLSFAVALSAFALSVLALMLRWIDRRRADVIAFIGVREVWDGKSKTYVVVRNIGKSVARDVDVEYLLPNGATGLRFQYQGREHFPVPFLVPAVPYAVPVFIVIGVQTSFEVRVTWRDGRRRVQSSTMTVHVAGMPF